MSGFVRTNSPTHWMRVRFDLVVARENRACRFVVEGVVISLWQADQRTVGW